MFSFRTARFTAAVLIAALVPALASAQSKDEKKKKEAQRAQYLAMAKLVDGAMAQPPADSAIRWESELSLKAQENKTYVPFTIVVDPTKINPGTGVLYMRVVSKSAPTPTPAADDEKKNDKNEAPVIYPFEDLQPVQFKAPAAGQPYRVSRAFAVPAGEYDLYVAVAEQIGQPSKDKAAIGRTSVMKQTVTIPNYWGTDLTTSPIVLADKIEPLAAPLAPEQQAERPYVLGNMEITPAEDHTFSKKEELSLIFLIYNVQVNEAGKPDVEVDYRFNQKTGETEKFFNRTQPQQFNATTLPAQFDVRAGHQVVGGQTIPLASFPEGDYRLEIKINDKLGSKSLTRDVTFTVTP